MDLHFPLRSVFFAIPLQETAKHVFQELQHRLKDFDDILRYQNPESPHLTLQFWKEVMEIEYYQIIPQSKEIADASAPFTLKVQGVSTFGSRGEDRVLYLNIPFSDELARLKKRCPWPSLRPHVAGYGRQASIEPFAPHITLARIKHPQDVKSPVGDHVPFTGKFAVQKKRIMKLLGDVDFEIVVDRVRLYAEVNGVKQTMLQDFLFKH